MEYAVNEVQDTRGTKGGWAELPTSIIQNHLVDHLDTYGIANLNATCRAFRDCFSDETMPFWQKLLYERSFLAGNYRRSAPAGGLTSKQFFRERSIMEHLFLKSIVRLHCEPISQLLITENSIIFRSQSESWWRMDLSRNGVEPSPVNKICERTTTDRLANGIIPHRLGSHHMVTQGMECIVTGASVQVRNARTNRLLQKFKGRPLATCSLAINGYLYQGTASGRIYQWLLETGKKILCIRGHGKRITSLEAGSNGDIFSASEDGIIRRWNFSCLSPSHPVTEYGFETEQPSLGMEVTIRMTYSGLPVRQSLCGRCTDCLCTGLMRCARAITVFCLCFSSN